MSYQVIARRWRPQNFDQLVGQQSTKQALTNALTQERLHHAYLFTGTRGVGKTTIARILAKCLNCETKITATPCGQCTSCQEIAQGRFADLLEIDAASRTKVEDTREILDNIAYAPLRGRFKIYLIDEVHMLSNHSFNALLKTLEEPPEHVKFLLATTDPQKLPATVLSRCLQFHLKILPVEKIEQHLAHILSEEKFNFEQDALVLLAQAAQGSLRDALSLLDQAIALGNNQVITTDVRTMLGCTEPQHLVNLLNSLQKQDATLLLDEIKQLAESSPDFDQVLQNLLSTLHQITLIQLKATTITDESLLNLANLLSKEDIQLYYQIALIGRRDLPLMPSPRSGFEMIMLRMLAFLPKKNSKPTKLIQTSSSPTTVGTQTKVKPNQPANTVKPTPAAKPKSELKTPAISKPSIQTEDELKKHWPALVKKLDLKGATALLASHCNIKEFTENTLTLTVEPSQSPLVSPMLEQQFSNALSTLLDKPIKLKLVAERSPTPTPAILQAEENKAAIKAASQKINEDPIVQEILNTFDGKLVPNSVKLKET